MPSKLYEKKKPPASSRTCEFCSKILSSTRALKIHRNIHTGQKSYKCNLCDFATNESKTLTCHVRRHTGETPYKCGFSGCGYKSAEGSAVKQHFARMHSDLKPFECSLCPYKSKSKSKLNSHVKLRHADKSASSSSSEFKPFPCNFYDRKYTSQGNLIKHQNEKHQNSEDGSNKREKERQLFLCNLCGAEYKNSHALFIHMRSKHTMEKPYICEFSSCKPDFDSSVSKSGLKSHHHCVHNERNPKEGAANYKCNECNLLLKTKQGLKNHVIVHTSERNFLCPFENCSAAYKSTGVLKGHVKIVHETAEKPFKCALCPFSTTIKPDLSLHQKAIHSTAEEKSALMLSCPFSDCGHKTLQRSNLNSHVKRHINENLYECDICRKKFHHKTYLTKHKLMHDGIRNFPCALCPYRGSTAQVLKDHIRGHTKEKPFSCDFTSCGTCFRKSSYLTDHLATKHGKIAKEHKCTTEGCTVPPFATQSQLHNHIKLSHEPLKMYPCSQSDCQYESKWPTNVKRHEKTAHNDKEEMLCKGCGIFKMTNKASLKNHQDKYCATRKKYKCVQRNCKFIAESLEKLVKHKMDEHGIRRQASINMNLLKKSRKT